MAPTAHCYFFGTFNPLHIGHLTMATLAVAQLGPAMGFDRVVFIPAYNPPNKAGAPDITPFARRLAILERCIEDDPRLGLSAVEWQYRQNHPAEAGTGLPEPPVYTADILATLEPGLRTENKENEKPILLMGADTLATLAGWRGVADWLPACRLIIAPRTGFSLTPPEDLPRQPAAMAVLEVPPLDISATWLRQQLERSAARSPAEHPLRYLVPRAVLEQWPLPTPLKAPAHSAAVL